MKAKEFDKAFDEGADVSDLLEVTKAKRPEQAQKRVNVEEPLARRERGRGEGGATE